MPAVAAAAAAGTGAVVKMKLRARLTRKSINARRAADVTAARAQRLAERAHLDFDAVAHAECLGQAAPVRAVKPGGVGFVHHQPGAVFLLERDDFAQRRLVAVHARKRFR